MLTRREIGQSPAKSASVYAVKCGSRGYAYKDRLVGQAKVKFWARKVRITEEHLEHEQRGIGIAVGYVVYGYLPFGHVIVLEPKLGLVLSYEMEGYRVVVGLVLSYKRDGYRVVVGWLEGLYDGGGQYPEVVKCLDPSTMDNEIRREKTRRISP
ncbi:hypothetical protein Tco_0304306 [Tanacetum coccineum]